MAFTNLPTSPGARTGATEAVFRLVAQGISRHTDYQQKLPQFSGRVISNALHGLVFRGRVVKQGRKNTTRYFPRGSLPVEAANPRLAPRRAPMPFVPLARDPFEAWKLAECVRR